MRASELTNSKLVIFDIDDTLVNTDTKVGVVKDGKTIKRLDSHDFTHYKLQPGEEFDFGAFRDAREFFANARPIAPMIQQLKNDIATGNRVIMVTARGDFNDRELFLDTFRKWDIDMSKVHVYRAGNIQMKVATEEKKKIILKHLLGQRHYDKVIMYDDAVPNLDAFLSLAQDYPWSKFYAWHVDRAGGATEYHRSGTGLKEEARASQDGLNIHYEYSADGKTLYVTAMDGTGERELGSVYFTDTGHGWEGEELQVDERYRGQGIARVMYDFAKSQLGRIVPNANQTDAGRRHWKGKEVWEARSQPVRAYHGNQGGINTERLHAPMWFSSSRADAEQYAGDDGYVVVVDLDISNPYVLRPGEEANTVLRRWQALQTQGYDGIYDRRLGDWIPFSKEQIRVISKDNVMKEHFADGKVKGKSRPGRVKRAGASCKGSVTDLRARAKKYGGERGKMYHWCANMKSGRKNK